MINSYWLKTFDTLVETQSFTKTAKALFMSQPGVSQHIKKLENHIGQKLIIRQGKNFELTPHGQSVVRYARRLIEEEQLLHKNICDVDPHCGKCSVSCPDGVGVFIYPWLLDMQQQWPKLNIHFGFNPTHEVEKSIKNGDFDLGIITHQTIDPELIMEQISEERLCLILPEEKSIENFDQLEKLGFIDHPDGRMIATKVLSRIFKNTEIDISTLKTSGFINSIEKVCEPVARGFGYTVLHENIVNLSPVFEQLNVIVPEQALVQDINVIYNKKWPLHPRYRGVIDHLKLRFKARHQNLSNIKISVPRPVYKIA
ncbi:MAG: LysR family transcriptional regulator [Desulfuromusa sp.]|nr:LysR family transcriptional regulator [Desulfuromusa sp.]